MHSKREEKISESCSRIAILRQTLATDTTRLRTVRDHRDRFTPPQARDRSSSRATRLGHGCVQPACGPASASADRQTREQRGGDVHRVAAFGMLTPQRLPKAVCGTFTRVHFLANPVHEWNSKQPKSFI